MRRGVLIAAAALAVGACACEDVSHADIGDEINILVRRDDPLVPPAIVRLAAYKRAAIPQIETAMHTAAPSGRLHLIAALDRIGDGEGVPVLRQVAIYDVTPDVRDAAEAVLARWSAAGDARGRRAAAGLDAIARKRAAGEGPLEPSAAGIPGVPSTVGAVGPVGAAPDTR